MKNSHIKGRITDYSANTAVVEFDDLHKNKHYINELMEFQYMLGGCQKIADILYFNIALSIENSDPQKAFSEHKLLEEKLIKLFTDFSIPDTTIKYSLMAIKKLRQKIRLLG